MAKIKFDELHKLKPDYFEPMQITGDDKARRRELASYLTDAFLFFFAFYEVNEAHRQYGQTQKEYYERVLADKITDAVTKVTGIDSYMSDHIKDLSSQVVSTTLKNANKDSAVEPGGLPLNNKKNIKPLIKPTSLDIDGLFPALLIDEDVESSLSPSFVDDSPDLAARMLRLEQEIEEGDEEEDLETAEKDYWLSYRRAEEIAQSESNSFLNYTDYVEAKNKGATKKTWLTMLDDKVRDSHEEIEGRTITIDEYFTVGNSRMKFPHDLSESPDPKEVINCRCAVIYS